MPITMLVIGLLLVGVASAALVGYLSNAVTATADVDSPLQLQIRNEGQSNWHESTSLGSLRGGDTATLYIRERNHANNPIETNIEIIINEVDKDNVCAELTKVLFTDIAANWTIDLLEEHSTYSPNGCVVVEIDDFDALVLRPFPGQPLAAGQDKEFRVEVTFAQNAVGNYQASIQHMMPNWTG